MKTTKIVDKKIMKPLIHLFFVFVSFTFLFAQPTFERDKKTEELFLRGEKYFFQKKYNVAYSVLLKVLQQIPDHKRALPLVADIAFFKGDFKTALNYYQQAVDVVAQPYKEYFRMGQIYLLEEKADMAISNFQKALDHNEFLTIAYFQIGYVYLVKKEDSINAKKYWQKFLEQAPGDRQAEAVKKIISKIDSGELDLPKDKSNFQIDY